MKKLTVGLLAMLLILCLCGTISAEANGVAVYTPSSIAFGDDLVMDVRLPEATGALTVCIDTPTPFSSTYYIGELLTENYTASFYAMTLTDYGLTPGSYTITYIWASNSGSEVLSCPLEVTGAPYIPPTVTCSHYTASVGDEIVFSGETGSASKLNLVILKDDLYGAQSHDDVVLDVAGDDTWSYPLTVPESIAKYSVTCYVMNSEERNIDSVTGPSVLIVDESLPMPEIQLETEECRVNEFMQMTLTANVDQVNNWAAWIVDGTTGETMNPSFLGNWNPGYMEFYPTHAGDYTFYASYLTSSGYSSPAVMSVTIPETGNANQPLGTLPVTLSVPTSLPAGQNLVLPFDYTVENEEYHCSLYYYSDDTNIYERCMTIARNGEALVIPGYMLEEGGAYGIKVTAYAENGEQGTAVAYFSVSANLDCPPAPQISLEDTAYARIPVTFSVDDGWEKIALRYTGTYSSPSWNECSPNKATLTFDSEDVVEVFAIGMKNGIWSEESQPLTLTVEELPQVTEITPFAPTSIRWGEDFFGTVLTPNDYGTLTLSIDTPEPYNYAYDVYENTTSFNYLAYALLGNGLVPGSYTVTYTWENGDEKETVSRPLEVTGEVKQPITVSVNQYTATAGDTLIISGETGDASFINIYLNWSSFSGSGVNPNVRLNVEPDSAWSYTVTVPENKNQLIAYVVGYTDDDLLTGPQSDINVNIYDASLPEPVLELTTESPSTNENVCLNVGTDFEGFGYWHVTCVDETTGLTQLIWGDNLTPQQAEFYFFPEYAGEYTVYAYYDGDGKNSPTSALQITVTGKPHPSHGKAPINVTEPDVLLAGQDAVFALEYVAENQSFQYSVSKKNAYDSYEGIYYSDTLTDNRPILVPGYLLEAGETYHLDINSSAEDWYYNAITYEFTVSPNPDQPQPPVLHKSDDHTVYVNIPVFFSVDEGWERIVIRYRGPNSNMGYTDSNPNKLSVVFYGSDIVEVFVKGLKNGIWSEESQPLTLTVEEFPQVTEITPFAPASIRWGEDFFATVLTPYDYGQITLSIDTPNVYQLYTDIYSYEGHPFDILAEQLINFGLMPGSYTVTYTWENGDEKETVSRPLEVTGEVKQPIAVSVNQNIATAGDTIIFSGDTGDASFINIYLSWSNNSGSDENTVRLNVEPDSVWSYTVTVPENKNQLTAYAVGYTDNYLVTGPASDTIIVDIYDASLPEPVLELTTESPSTSENVYLNLGTDIEGFEYWYVTCVDETTGLDQSIWSSNWALQQGELYFYPEYAGEYTVYAVYYSDGKMSPTAELHITVAGKPHPSHGKVPINLVEPDTIVAGLDALFVPDYATEGQNYSFDIAQANQYGGYDFIYSNSIQNGPIRVPGYLLDAGKIYTLNVNSSAEDWYSNSAVYSFTVSTNPDQSDPPVLSLKDSQSVYEGVPTRFSVDEGWEKIAIQYQGDNYGRSNWDDYTPNSIRIPFYNQGVYSIIAKGLKNGVWSEASEPLTCVVEPIPQVTEITPLTPSSIQWGEYLPVDVLYPYDYGTMTISIDTSGYCFFSYDLYGYRYSININAGSLIASGLTPGSYTITYTWTDGQQTETVTRPLEVTGEVTIPITVSADHVTATAGDTIVFSGETGDASRIHVNINWQENETWLWEETDLDVVPNNTWSYSLTIPEAWTYLHVYFTGYTSDNIYAGEKSINLGIYDTTLTVPTVQLITENPTAGNSIWMNVETDTDSFESWNVSIVDETTGEQSSPWVDTTQQAEFSFCPEYAGDYTVYASYWAGGKLSAPAELHITVTGLPHPTHGKVPITLTAPTSLLAGQDAVFALDYAVDGQYFYWRLDQKNEYGLNTIYSGDMLTNNEVITVPGYLLEAGTVYNVNISSGAEDWYNNYRDYEFTVSPNPDRPQPPVLTLADEAAYANLPINFTVDEGWEAIAIQYQGDSIGFYGWTSYEVDSLVVKIYEPDTVAFYVRGLKNGVWSEVSQPLTLTVEELPQVTEITPLTPSSVRWGEDLLVSALFPYDYGTVSVTINTPDPYSDNSYLNSHVYSQRFYASGMIHYGLMPGSYTITYTWEDGDQTETISRPLEVTGDAKEPSTISVDRNYAVEGDQIVYSGETGDAVRIQLQIRRYIDQQELIDYVWLNVTPNSTWSYTVTAQENVSEYATYCEGYTSDNLCTGYNYAGSVEICDASLAAPAIQLLTENPLTGQENRMSVEAPTEIEYWNVYYVDETTGISIYPASEDTQCFEFSFYPNYAGEYTVYASYFANGGKRSAPAELHITVTGTPHPSHGNVPIEFTTPESILAGQDTVFALDYAIDDQSFSWALWQENDNDPSVIYWGGILRDNQSLIVPGYVLEDSKTYRLVIDSEADDWYRNHLEYNFSVSANPDRPQPPALALADEHAYAGIPFSLSVDEGWETIAIQFHGDSIGSTIDWQEYNPDDLSLSFPDPDTVEIYAMGLRNGVWSEVSEPLTVTVEESQVTEITPFTPESIRLGEDLYMYALLPYNYGTIRVFINTPNPYYSSNYRLNGQREFDWYFDAGELIRAGMTPGSYTITFTWTDGQQTESVSCPLEVTGEAVASPTITVNQTDIAPGDTIVFSGDTGSSERIWLRIWFESNSSWNYQEVWLDVAPNSTWTYSLPAQNRAYCRARCEGFTADDLSVGTTWNIETRIHDATMPLGTVQLLTENPTAGSDVTVSAITEAANFEEWYIYCVDSTTDSITSRWYISNQPTTVTFNPQYGGDYTVYASYVADGKMSAPAELHVTVTGTPHPSHGMVQMQLTAPETILAGQDAVFNLGYFVEGQTYYYKLYEYINGVRYTAYSYSSYWDAWENIVLPGFVLEEGCSYSLYVETRADDWYNNQTQYDFTVAENPNRPQPPVLTLEDEFVYLGLPVHYSVDEGWEEIAMGSSIIRGNELVSNGYISWTRRYMPLVENYMNGVTHATVYAKGLKNGVWSKASQPVEFDVIDGPKLSQVQVVSAPEQLIVGQPFTVVLEPLENAENYVLELYYDNGGRLTRIGNAQMSDQPTLTFDDWNGFEEEGNYQIILGALAEGYNHYPSENRINLIGLKPSPVVERVYTLPAAVKEIEEEAFAGVNATIIVIPNGCHTIGTRAFAGCVSLTRVVIPASVTSIAEDAFDSCGELTVVTSEGSTAHTFAVAKGYQVELTD